MENQEKLKKVSLKATKLIKVLRIIFLVCAIICAIAGIMAIIMTATGGFKDLYESYPKEFGKITVGMSDDVFFDLVDKDLYEVKLSTVYANGDLEMVGYGAGIMALVGAVECVVMNIVLMFFGKIFAEINTSESPFTESIAKKLKIAFIVFGIFILLQSVFLGLCVGALFICIYLMYLHGIELQKNEDETL